MIKMRIIKTLKTYVLPSDYTSTFADDLDNIFFTNINEIKNVFEENSIIENKGNNVSIKPSRDWENEIYRNGAIQDLMIWNHLK